ncbi:hypothetical protein IWW55_006314 [Coemansia sp. RSA 2706]|nr:hypothetical protein IWW55_006314 [Coemansia sp. RSA 2706]KAJ2316164.1 hypothetical protein IWW51_005710 [Coemansia sp. RSA 2702]KAJ2316203.1 hypothetical protein IWW52_003762 [Coemansia sp. RSA 2704]
MYHGPPPRSDSGGPPAGFTSQYSQYPAGQYNNAPRPPPVAQGQSIPGRYSPPIPPSMGRPMSQYDPSRPPQPSRASMSHAPSHAARPNDHMKSHYGDLVTEGPGGTTACSGDAWGACCKYNTLACLLCCNGCLRLCGGGMSLMEVLHLN